VGFTANNWEEQYLNVGEMGGGGLCRRRGALVDEGDGAVGEDDERRREEKEDDSADERHQDEGELHDRDGQHDEGDEAVQPPDLVDVGKEPTTMAARRKRTRRAKPLLPGDV